MAFSSETADKLFNSSIASLSKISKNLRDPLVGTFVVATGDNEIQSLKSTKSASSRQRCGHASFSSTTSKDVRDPLVGAFVVATDKDEIGQSPRSTSSRSTTSRLRRCRDGMNGSFAAFDIDTDTLHGSISEFPRMTLGGSAMPQPETEEEDEETLRNISPAPQKMKEAFDPLGRRKKEGSSSLPLSEHLQKRRDVNSKSNPEVESQKTGSMTDTSSSTPGVVGETGHGEDDVPDRKPQVARGYVTDIQTRGSSTRSPGGSRLNTNNRRSHSRMSSDRKKHLGASIMEEEKEKPEDEDDTFWQDSFRSLGKEDEDFLKGKDEEEVKFPPLPEPEIPRRRKAHGLSTGKRNKVCSKDGEVMDKEAARELIKKHLAREKQEENESGPVDNKNESCTSLKPMRKTKKSSSGSAKDKNEESMSFLKKKKSSSRSKTNEKEGPEPSSKHRRVAEGKDLSNDDEKVERSKSKHRHEIGGKEDDKSKRKKRSSDRPETMSRGKDCPSMSRSGSEVNELPRSSSAEKERPKPKSKSFTIKKEKNSGKSKARGRSERGERTSKLSSKDRSESKDRRSPVAKHDHKVRKSSSKDKLSRDRSLSASDHDRSVSAPKKTTSSSRSKCTRSLISLHGNQDGSERKQRSSRSLESLSSKESSSQLSERVAPKPTRSRSKSTPGGSQGVERPIIYLA